MSVKSSSKVYIIDDDEVVLTSLGTVLTQEGYRVKCFTTAEAFFAQHHPTQVGCVLVDLAVPGNAGRELLRGLQESGSLLAIVSLSGLIDSAMLNSGPEAQSPTLIQPDQLNTLLTMIEDGIAGSARRRARRLRDPSDPRD